MHMRYEASFDNRKYKYVKGSDLLLRIDIFQFKFFGFLLRPKK
jgi:hypothetical protein